MVDQELVIVTSTVREQNSSGFADVQCPDCFAPLALYYDQRSNARHYCENCGQEVNERCIDREWDDDDNSDNNISTEYIDASNRRVY